MSVINKMLRDLDHRRAANTAVAVDGTIAVQIPSLQDHAAQAPRWMAHATMPHQRPWVWLAGLAVLAALAAGVWFVWQQNSPPDARSAPGSGSTAEPVVIAPSRTPPTILAAAAPAPVLGGAVPVPAPVTVLPGTAAPGAVALRMEESLSTGRALQALLSAPAPTRVAATQVTRPVALSAAPAASEPAPPAPAPERSQGRPAVATPLVPPPATTSATKPTGAPLPDAAPSIQRQQQAGGDALAQAQSLWNSGAQAAAVELMQQSVAAAERSAKAGTNPGANGLLLPLVRELARMQLAQGRYGAVWELLSRLEPFLGNQSDLWAIRANAAQRLGRHQDSVHAYLVALQSRPDEQRWLLGTAVSLAALGQTSSATEMAEKARAVAPVSKEIAAYLRQAGVVFKD